MHIAHKESQYAQFVYCRCVYQLTEMVSTSTHDGSFVAGSTYKVAYIKSIQHGEREMTTKCHLKDHETMFSAQVVMNR